MIGRPPDENDPLGSSYVSTSADIDKALSDCNGDISKLEASLGFPEGHFGDGPIVRVDIHNPEDHGLRIANGREAGANEFYNTPLDENGNLPNIQYCYDDNGRRCVDSEKTDPAELSKLNGQYWDQDGQYHPPNTEGYPGKTSGGQDEAVINQVPNTPENVSYTKIDGFNRGESGNIKTSTLTDSYAPPNEASKTNLSRVSGELPPQTRQPSVTDEGQVSGTLPPQNPPPPKEHENQISGTLPDQAQGIDLPNNHTEGAAGKDLAENAAKKNHNGPGPYTGIS